MKLQKSTFKNLSYSDIDKLISLLTELKTEKQKEKEVIEKILSNAVDNNVSYSTLIKALQQKTKQDRVKPRYKLTINGQEFFYSGKGKKPNWLIKYLNEGGNLEELKI